MTTYVFIPECMDDEDEFSVHVHNIEIHSRSKSDQAEVQELANYYADQYDCPVSAHTLRTARIFGYTQDDREEAYADYAMGERSDR